MSDLQLYTTEQPGQLQLIRSAVENGKLIHQINDYSFYNIMVVAITLIHRDLRAQLPETEDLEHMAKEVVQRCRNKRYNIRDQEIIIAFRNGINMDYGKYFGLNAISFNQFIAGYMDHPDRKSVLELRNKPAELKIEPTLKRQFWISKKNAIKAYQLVLKNKSTGALGSAVYDFFFKIKIFTIDQQEIDELLSEGKGVFIEELKSYKKLLTDPIRRKNADKEIERITFLPPDQPVAGGVIGVAKRIYIDRLFEQFMKLEEYSVKDLFRIIEEKRDFFIKLTEYMEAERAKSKQNEIK